MAANIRRRKSSSSCVGAGPITPGHGHVHRRIGELDGLVRVSLFPDADERVVADWPLAGDAPQRVAELVARIRNHP